MDCQPDIFTFGAEYCKIDIVIELNSVVSKSTELLASELDGELVMMDVETGKYFGLNGVGSVIWNLIDKPHSVSEICSQLEKEYDVEASTCEQEVLAFLNSMDTEKMLVIA